MGRWLPRFTREYTINEVDTQRDLVCGFIEFLGTCQSSNKTLAKSYSDLIATHQGIRMFGYIMSYHRKVVSFCRVNYASYFLVILSCYHGIVLLPACSLYTSVKTKSRSFET